MHNESDTAQSHPDLSQRVAQWEAAYWRGTASRQADKSSDGFVVTRWATYIAEWEETGRILSAEGASTPAPIPAHRRLLETAITQLEDSLLMHAEERRAIGLTLPAYGGGFPHAAILDRELRKQR